MDYEGFLGGDTFCRAGHPRGKPKVAGQRVISQIKGQESFGIAEAPSYFLEGHIIFWGWGLYGLSRSCGATSRNTAGLVHYLYQFIVKPGEGVRPIETYYSDFLRNLREWIIERKDVQRCNYLSLAT
jgi:hypothetical protein